MRRYGFATALLFAVAIQCTAATDPLKSGFESPPNSAQPRVWWHWMNGNVTPEGIRLDLQWMRRVGIGGLDCIDASIDTPQVVKQRLIYMSPGWKDAFRSAAKLADDLGMEFSIDSSPGWSETGGPWVKPAQAMKKLVWSKTVVQGGRPFKGLLAHPPTVTGPFQNVPLASGFFDSTHPNEPAQYYADAAVIAYRQPGGPPSPLNVVVTSSAGEIDAVLLNDGDLQKSVLLPAVRGSAWIQFTYAQPQTFRSAVLGTPLPGSRWADPGPMMGQLEAQDEKGTFRTVATLAIGTSPEVTVSFNPVTAKAFRMVFSIPAAMEPINPPAPGVDPTIQEATVAANRSFAISELSLQQVGSVNEYERKAGFAIAEDYYALATPKDAADAPVSPTEVLDISGQMKPDGLLDWTPPQGQWVVLRLGYSLTGKTNHPATPEATGLEVDKLDRGAVHEYMRRYLDTYSGFLPAALVGAHGLRAVLVDSTEVGPQNWTNDLLAQFQRLRGYDPRPWLPALTGVLIRSAEASDEFLWDFRRTLAELAAQSHYAEIASSVHGRGLKVYGEALEYRRPVLGDELEMRRYADVPTGAMWVHSFSKGPLDTYVADDRGAASVAHLFGQNLAAAESFTSDLSPWAFAPRELKPIADMEFALGINRIIVHTSVHQPTSQAPGLTLGPFGQYFNRHDTWAEEAGPWISYLARSSYLLQQGRYAADVAYFYGEEAPLTILQGQGRLEDVPKQFAFDFVNADAIVNLFSVQDGKLTTPAGMRYRVLQLGGTSGRMTLPVLRKLKELVEKGATVVGAAPIATPSLADDTAEFERINVALWGSDGHGGRLGAGRVYGRESVEEALACAGVAPDIVYSRPHEDTNLMFVHRALSEGEVYFLSHHSNRQEDVDVSFRVTGKAAELWHAETGRSEPVSYRIENGRTIVPLKLEPFDAVFVLFRQSTARTSQTIPEPVSRVLTEFHGPWALSFQSGRGAPASMTIDRLDSWSNSTLPGVEYFSGTATYRRTVEAAADWLRPGARLELDLGEVRELARVLINGKSLGVLWKPPYTIDVTNSLHPGQNTLEIQVTNLWVNRLIGDQQPGATRYAFTTVPTYIRAAPLQSSGLLGPVILRTQGEYARAH